MPPTVTKAIWVHGDDTDRDELQLSFVKTLSPEDRITTQAFPPPYNGTQKFEFHFREQTPRVSIVAFRLYNVSKSWKQVGNDGSSLHATYDMDRDDLTICFTTSRVDDDTTQFVVPAPAHPYFLVAQARDGSVVKLKFLAASTYIATLEEDHFASMTSMMVNMTL